MSLNQIAAEMKEVATTHPHLTEVNPICPTVCYREVRFAGQKIDTVFTLDVWMEDQRAWHLTITPERDLKEEELSEILTAFFGIGMAQLPVLGSLAALKGKLLEMTTLIKESAPFPLHPKQRQFMQLL